MTLSEQRKGEWHVISAAILGGFFPIVIVFTYASVSSLISLIPFVLGTLLLTDQIRLMDWHVNELSNE